MSVEVATPRRGRETRGAWRLIAGPACTTHTRFFCGLIWFVLAFEGNGFGDTSSGAAPHRSEYWFTQMQKVPYSDIRHRLPLALNLHRRLA